MWRILVEKSQGVTGWHLVLFLLVLEGGWLSQEPPWMTVQVVQGQDSALLGAFKAQPALRLLWTCPRATRVTLQIDGENGDRETETVQCDEQPRSLVINREQSEVAYVAISAPGTWQIQVQESVRW